MRWTFPQDRLVYSYSLGGPLYPLAAGSSLSIFLDQDCTEPADLQDISGHSIGNVIAIGNDTLLPLFLGPDSTYSEEVLALWAQPPGATGTYQLDAVLAERISQQLQQKQILVSAIEPDPTGLQTDQLWYDKSTEE